MDYLLRGILIGLLFGLPVGAVGTMTIAPPIWISPLMEFTAKKSSGKVEVAFTFDATSLEGKTTVIFEELQQNGQKLAVHADLKDTDQQMFFLEIGTTAKDGKDGDQEAFAEKETQITDTVAYKGLIAGESYRLVGTLMDKETGKEALIDGKPVTAETTFKPEKPEGTVDVTFTFDAEALNGHDVVVFEKFYVTVKEEDKEKEIELTNHEDIQAESQTVKLTEVPTEPEKPADTPDAPKTGDTTNLWIPVAVLVAALAGIVAVIIRIRRKKF